MKKHYVLLLLPMMFAGCFNDRGISLRYYNDCEEYYDAQGYYHKQCDKNLVDYKEVQEALQPAQKPTGGSVR
ncbi:MULTISPECIES: hypothetical protein [unclassified Sulfuricurvum]|uniref:hypothetical protein n=1 Tax=unclassified Sulfuricurvum TaxID=2632390 RepID=UPI000321279E|nr:MULTISPECIES: hypothetical protein [unclassified Sulfuricurvum]OHD83629.1 MAG: hypothetical protein A3J39_09775 [Sulfuricurvum sp. RIFCSPHIGHO2_12_FULL_44_8]OHD84154.1 MAG: hypothetical protein A2Y52_10325 [Sulfuricurvum sp. RIFCSPLOWO2_02_43_6]OHD86090.1 MAG: hypothetical protein A3I60_06650 [Sulfuricurvum sp. RIFCSPLOWO2_02_FULL_43_45]OHD91980.1 MAG: hypothetical protein A2W83_03370 [Sulfuricurvum sp. RIFCSPLOWO2_12_43_5]OHD90144.1 MAG: hypothetical protein A3G19_09495 [Sulfuricurvum sp. 